MNFLKLIFIRLPIKRTIGKAKVHVSEPAEPACLMTYGMLSFLMHCEVCNYHQSRSKAHAKVLQNLMV